MSPDDRQWTPPEPAEPALGSRSGAARRLLLALAGLAVVAVGFNAATGGSGPGEALPTAAHTPAASATGPTPFPSSALWMEECQEVLGGLVLTGSPTPRGVPHEAWDCQPDPANRQGTVLRRVGDGAFARHSAVVMWPLPAAEVPTATLPPDGLLREHGSVPEIVVDTGTAFARIRGDLPVAQLRAIAWYTLVQSGFLQVGPPEGFVKVTGLRYSPPLVHEVRYTPAVAGLQGLVGQEASVYTGLLRTAQLEDELLAEGVTPAGSVRGHPAVVSLDGRLLAWEPEPGYTAYVGVGPGSGPAVRASASLTAAMLALAQRTRVVSAQEFGRIGAG